MRRLICLDVVMLNFDANYLNWTIDLTAAFMFCNSEQNRSFLQRNGTKLKTNLIHRTLSNGANHTSIAASVGKLLVFFNAPTQHGQTIDSSLPT